MLTHVQRGTDHIKRQLGLSDNLALLDRVWDAEIGPLARVARIVAIDRDSLVVEANSAPAVQEISLRRKELVRRINKHFPDNFIKQIVVKVKANG